MDFEEYTGWTRPGLVPALAAMALCACTQAPTLPEPDISRHDPVPSVTAAAPRESYAAPSARATVPQITPDTEIRALTSAQLERQKNNVLVDGVCHRIARKLANVGYEACASIGLTASRVRSVNGTPILFKRYPARPDWEPLGRVLLLGGTHGDELTSVSVVFDWMRSLEKYHSGVFEWLVAPLVNPDGVLRRGSVRTNANRVDLNRNFPTPEWQRHSKLYWKSTGHDPRRYPGPAAGSEPETRWVVDQIEQFKPDVILSVHAPFKLLDFDAPDRNISPVRLGILYKHLMGTFPGSLGNYAGVQRGIPVVTLELPHSWIMPEKKVVDHLWQDTIRWLKLNMDHAQAQKLAVKTQ